MSSHGEIRSSDRSKVGVWKIEQRADHLRPRRAALGRGADDDVVGPERESRPSGRCRRSMRPVARGRTRGHSYSSPVDGANARIAFAIARRACSSRFSSAAAAIAFVAVGSAGASRESLVREVAQLLLDRGQPFGDLLVPVVHSSTSAIRSAGWRASMPAPRSCTMQPGWPTRRSDRGRPPAARSASTLRSRIRRERSGCVHASTRRPRRSTDRRRRSRTRSYAGAEHRARPRTCAFCTWRRWHGSWTTTGRAGRAQAQRRPARAATRRSRAPGR